MTDKILDVVHKAQQGDMKALDHLVKHIQDQVHRLSIRMLVDPTRAEEATQEILIRVVTKLSTFRRGSRFETWVYRVATNYLLSERKSLQNDAMFGFDQFGADLENGLVDETQMAPDDHIMLNHMRIMCTMAMLLCLDKHHRIAYVLGKVFEMDQNEATEILCISKDTYRQRLSRASKQVQDFTAKACGLANQNAKCTCQKRLKRATELGCIPEKPNPLFDDAPSFQNVRREALRTEAALVDAKLQRSMGTLKSPKDFSVLINGILDPPS